MNERSTLEPNLGMPTAHEELKILEAMHKELRALWATVDLVERRWQIDGVEVDEPTSRAAAVESCNQLKVVIEKVLAEAEGHYRENLEMIAACTGLGLHSKEINVASPKTYAAWIKSVVKLQFNTRSWRERIWLEVDSLPWTETEQTAITWQLLWESTPPEWLSRACRNHHLPLVSEPPALGRRNEALDRPTPHPKGHTIRELANWANARLDAPRKVSVREIAEVPE